LERDPDDVPLVARLVGETEALAQRDILVEAVIEPVAELGECPLGEVVTLELGSPRYRDRGILPFGLPKMVPTAGNPVQLSSPSA
jgi:hypothetical protein